MPRSLPKIVALVLFVQPSGPLSVRAQQAPGGQEQGQPAAGGPQRGHFRGNIVFGRIQSISPTEMKLSAPDGSTVTVHLSSKTVFRMEQRTAKLDEFKVGTAVFARGTKTGDSTWDAELVAVRNGPQPVTQGLGKDLVAGTVKAIEGTKITIVRLDNVTQTIEADENTSFLKHRESITLADVHTGDAVAVRGETKDGTFAPRTLNVLDPAQLERLKQFAAAGGPPGATPPAAPSEKKPEPQSKPPQDFR